MIIWYSKAILYMYKSLWSFWFWKRHLKKGKRKSRISHCFSLGHPKMIYYDHPTKKLGRFLPSVYPCLYVHRSIFLSAFVQICLQCEVFGIFTIKSYNDVIKLRYWWSWLLSHTIIFLLLLFLEENKYFITLLSLLIVIVFWLSIHRDIVE